ncbi:hypothetical protein C7B82_14175 [Stenomitos frigidus ULC18]|uniref:Uncharacterized protein n=1 Tax=Stenomitos frigidus ULC18 TaxID=2107698 RepID=A0A2T1E5J6_9CYAN|nr:hypothetical protein C7B82_14175 [Stenomitos frigidus ULC18]
MVNKTLKEGAFSGAISSLRSLKAAKFEFFGIKSNVLHDATIAESLVKITKKRPPFNGERLWYQTCFLHLEDIVHK